MISKLFPVFLLLLTATLKGTLPLNTSTSKPVTNEVTSPSATSVLNETIPNVNVSSVRVSLENPTTTAEPILTKNNLKTLPNESSTLVFVTENPRDRKPTNSPEILTELKKIFNVVSDNSNETYQEYDLNYNESSKMADCQGRDSTDFICFGKNVNDTTKTNYTLIAEAMESLEYRPAFRLQKSAAIAAAVFLLSAIAGYLSCVTYRHYLQRKYGESQRVAPEDVYDTTDLRYFEI